MALQDRRTYWRGAAENHFREPAIRQWGAFNAAVSRSAASERGRSAHSCRWTGECAWRLSAAGSAGADDIMDAALSPACGADAERHNSWGQGGGAGDADAADGAFGPLAVAQAQGAQGKRRGATRPRGAGNEGAGAHPRPDENTRSSTGRNYPAWKDHRRVTQCAARAGAGQPSFHSGAGGRGCGAWNQPAGGDHPRFRR